MIDTLRGTLTDIGYAPNEGDVGLPFSESYTRREQPCNLCGSKFEAERLTTVMNESSGAEYFCSECIQIKDDDQEELVIPPEGSALPQ